MALLLAGAVSSAFAAQYLFTGEAFTRLRDSNSWDWSPRYGAGIVLLLVAGALTAWLASRDDDEPVPLACNRPLRRPFLSWAVGGSLGLTAAAIGLFLIAGESLAVRTLWVLAMVTLVLPLLRPLGERRIREWSAWEGPALLALTFAGFLLRFYRLTELPDHIDDDVALMGAETLRLMQGHDARWFGIAASDHLLSVHQLKAFAFQLFGADHFGLVMPSVLAGTLTLPVLYVLVRAAFSRRVALVSTVLLATSYTHIQFSRTMFGPIATFFLCLSLAHLVHALRAGISLYWAAAGLAMGLSLLTYDSSRVGPVIVLVFFAIRALLDRKTLRTELAGWGVFLAGLVVGFGPMAGFVLRDFGSFVGRGSKVMIWSPGALEHALNKYKASSIPEVLFDQARSTFLTLHLYGDGSPHFAFPRPMVGALAAALVVLGTGCALVRARRAQNHLVLAWVLATFVLGGVLTSDPPYWPHLNIALPAIAILGGIGADRLIRSFSTIFPDGTLLASGLMALALLASGVHNWIVYARWGNDNADARVEASRFLETLPDETEVFLVADATSWGDYTFRFFNREMEGWDVTADDLLSGRVPLPAGRPYAILLFEHQDTAPRLRGLSPLSKVEALGDPSRGVVVTIAAIPPGFVPRARPEPNRPGLVLLVLGALGATGWVGFRFFRDVRRRR